MQSMDGRGSDDCNGGAGRGDDLRQFAALDAMGMLDEFDSAAFDRSFRAATPALQSELRELQARVAVDPAFLAQDDEPSADLKARTIARVMTAVDSHERALAPIAHIGRTSARAARAGSVATGQELVLEQAIELTTLRADVDRLSRSSYYWRAAAIALTAALTVAFVFQVATERLADRVAAFALGNAGAQQMLELIHRPEFAAVVERSSKRALRPVGAGSPDVAIAYFDKVTGQAFIEVVGARINAGLTVRHVSEDGMVTVLGAFEPENVRWVAAIAAPGTKVESFLAGSIQVVDEAGTVLLSTT